MALASASTFSGSVVRTQSGGEGLPKVCCRRTSKFGHLGSQCSSDCSSPLHSGSAAGSSNWAYTLRSGVCLDRRRARKTASALLESAMQSTFQEKCSYTMAVRSLLDGGSLTMRRMKGCCVSLKKVTWYEIIKAYFQSLSRAAHCSPKYGLTRPQKVRHNCPRSTG